MLNAATSPSHQQEAQYHLVNMQKAKDTVKKGLEKVTNADDDRSFSMSATSHHGRVFSDPRQAVKRTGRPISILPGAGRSTRHLFLARWIHTCAAPPKVAQRASQAKSQCPNRRTSRGWARHCFSCHERVEATCGATRC
jgi:hypothetical protein